MIDWTRIKDTDNKLYRVTMDASVITFTEAELPEKYTELRDGSYEVDFNGYKITEMFAVDRGEEFDFLSELPAVEDENGVGYILFDEDHKFSRLILSDDEGNTKECKTVFVEQKDK